MAVAPLQQDPGAPTGHRYEASTSFSIITGKFRIRSIPTGIFLGKPIFLRHGFTLNYLNNMAIFPGIYQLWNRDRKNYTHPELLEPWWPIPYWHILTRLFLF